MAASATNGLAFGFLAVGRLGGRFYAQLLAAGKRQGQHDRKEQGQQGQSEHGEPGGDGQNRIVR
jgi:hypothetical protein